MTIAATVENLRAHSAYSTSRHDRDAAMPRLAVVIRERDAAQDGVVKQRWVRVFKKDKP